MEQTQSILQPKVFISYAWGSDEHQQWVRDFAMRLIHSGVDVLLDQWDLKDGDNKYRYMERSVTDSSVTHVLIVCDKNYKTKADKREGGVGEESTVMSPEVYEQAKGVRKGKNKYLCIYKERDEKGKEYVPVMLNGSIGYFMDSPEQEELDFVRLLRTLFDKPEYAKPEVGKPPSWVLDDGSPLKTYSTVGQLKKAVHDERTSVASGLWQSYVEVISSQIKGLQRAVKNENNRELLDPQNALEQIVSLKSYRDEYLEILAYLCKFGHPTDLKLGLSVAKMLEDTYNAIGNSRITSNYYGDDLSQDHAFYLLWDLLLCTVTIFYKHERLEYFLQLVKYPYQLSALSGYETRQGSYLDFCREIRLLSEPLPSWPGRRVGEIFSKYNPSCHLKDAG